MHLLPRWRFENHPLFIAALKELRRAESSVDDVLNFDVKVPGFKDLLVPQKPGIKYSMLQSACKTMCEVAPHSTDEGLRKAYATSMQMTDALRKNADGNFSDVDISLSQHSGSPILSPRKRKIRRKEKVERSHSRLNFNYKDFPREFSNNTHSLHPYWQMLSRGSLLSNVHSQW
eukprot:snap_masked-scaffold_9-processed-gene-1.20-mRNA-1 protein AED:1.00 eAED:1.00 QI:0/0/0/0/1/1/3/0/173